MYLRLRHNRLDWQRVEQAARSERLVQDGAVFEAERPWRTSLRAVSSTLGDWDWETLEAKIDLASLLLVQGSDDKLTEAEQLLCPPAEPIDARHAESIIDINARAAQQRLSLIHI